MDIAANLALGFSEALSPENLFYCFLGVVLGTAVGVLPGIGSIVAIAVLLPITFHMPPTAAVIMIAGIYYGSMYGASTTAIMLNVPGNVASSVVLLDGYPMAQQGRAGPALVITTLASFFGGTVATVILAVAAPSIAGFALQFGAAEYVALMLLGLIAAAAIAQGSILKGLAMVVAGLLLGLIGTDVTTGVPRMSFGVPALTDGISIVVVAMGLFGFSEVIRQLENAASSGATRSSRVHWRELIPSMRDFRVSFKAIVRGTALGSLLGALPGTGVALSSFGAYSVEKRIAADPSRFGKGAIEGVAAPEAANNAAAQTSFIPTLSLGIPGSPVMALLLGALLIQGITPGVGMITSRPELFWGLIASMWIGNVLLLILNLPLIGIWIWLLTIPYKYLYPAVLAFCCIGAFSINNSSLDVFLAAGFGIVGYVLLRLRFELAPLILGFVLGTMFEENLRRALLISRGDPTTFFASPISFGLLILTAVIVALLVSPSIRAKLAARRPPVEPRGGQSPR